MTPDDVKRITSKAAGKGDGRRPMQITAEEYAANWEMAFGKRQKSARKKCGGKCKNKEQK